MRFRVIGAAVGVILSIASAVDAALIVNAPQAITKQVRVQVIDVANSDGTNAAPFLGTASQAFAIVQAVNTIWAQAGININFKFRFATYNSTFANTGTVGSNNPRPTSDLNAIISNAASAGGVLDPDPTILNLFMVRIVPGFSQTDDSTSNGRAVLNGNGITAWAGPTLANSSPGGQEAIASVLAHEIGHNLGLDHLIESQNLMQVGGSANEGERLNSSQITTARSSSFALNVPEPVPGSTLLGGAVVGLLVRRRRAA